MVTSRTDSAKELEQKLKGADETLKGKLKNHMGVYNIESTILLGFDGDKCVDQEFLIHEEAAAILFPEIRILPPASRKPLLFKPSKKAAAPPGGAIVLPEKRNGVNLNTEARNKLGRVFGGKKIRIPIPKIYQSQMKSYFGKGNRKTISMIFPPLASHACIGVWIATHCENTKVDEFPFFWSETGVKRFIRPEFNTVDAGKLKVLLGSWGTKMKNRLLDGEIAPNP